MNTPTEEKYLEALEKIYQMAINGMSEYPHVTALMIDIKQIAIEAAFGEEDAL